MAGENDIKAGGAFVEIGARLAPLQKALGQGSAMLRSWISDAAGLMQGLGAGLAAGGGAVLAPLIASGKALGDYGEELSNLRAQTGMSVDSLAALRVAAQSSGLSLRGVVGAVAQMQRALAAPTKDQQTALSALGLDAKALLQLSPEVQLASIADALVKIENPAQRTQIAMKAFGRGALELLPLIEGGSAAIGEAADQARRFGLVLDESGVQKAQAADAAFDGLGLAFEGFKLALGQAVAGFAPALERFSGLIARASAWIKLNPQVIESIAKVAVTALAAGTALAAVGAAIMALMSPALIAAAVIAGIGMAALAVTDALGVTRLGFAELFNAIRIDGTGLGTWLGAFALWMMQTWGEVTTVIAAFWDSFFTGWQNGWRIQTSMLLLIPEKLVQAWRWAAEQIESLFGAMIQTWNSIATQIGLDPIADSVSGKVSGVIKDAEQWIRKFRADLNLAVATDSAASADRRDRRLMDNDEAQRSMQARVEALFSADPQDGTGLGVDLERAKAALEGIGGNIWNGITGALESMVGGIEGLLPQAPEGGAGGGGPGFATAGDAALSKPEFSVAGTFSGAAAQGLAAAGLANRHFEEAKKSNQLLQRIAEQTEDLEVGLA